MEKKKLTLADFPIRVNDEVSAAFSDNAKMKTVVKIMMDALADSVIAMDHADPWGEVIKLMPEITEYQKAHPKIRIKYSYLTCSFSVVPG